MVRFVIDGNIGCGKSTLMRRLAEDGHVCFQEPVEEWDEMLQLFYKDKNRWSFTFQMTVLHSYLKQYPLDCVVERSPYSSYHVFGQCLYNGGFVSEKEWLLFKAYFDKFAWKPTNIIYIKTDPKVCLERIKTRSRDGESDIGLAYLKNLHFQYDNMFRWIKFDNVHIVDGDQDEESVYGQVKNILNNK